MIRRTGRLTATGTLTLALLTAAVGLPGTTGTAAAAPMRAAVSAPTGTAAPSAPTATTPASGWTARGEDYSAVATQTDLKIPMSDGTVLRGDLTLPATADGTAAAGRFPVVVTITAYNKTVLGSSDLGGGDPAYLVKRGYAQLTVDARGTGSSEGIWRAFSARENKDAGEIVEWAADTARPWSAGRVAMTGPSYMGISQIFAAGHQPKGLKAIFPQVPAADVYRDVVASGGQVDVGFIPLWMGLVTGTGVIPPAYGASEPAQGFKALTDHLIGAATFTVPLLLDALLGGDAAHDGPFYAERSPINVIDKVTVPTFLVAGHYDLFQRGTPLLFESLRKRGVPTKLVVGPWDHLQGSSGEDIDQAGYGELAELQLRWFDRHVRGIPDPALDSDIAPLTYFEQGSGTWRRTRDWVGSNLRARSFRLSGGATTAVRHGALTEGAAQPGTADVLPIPVAGLCSRSASQWTAGLPSAVAADLPCFSDNQHNDRTGVVFETDPVDAPVRLQGPINARLYTSSPSGDGMLSVSVSDVAPDGTVSRLTGGWQVLSHRALDEARTRRLDGKVIQAHHPFTAAAQTPLPRGAVEPIDVEVFPTGAVIEKGHRLRLAVQAFDVPHLLPSAPDLPGTLTVMKIHTSEAYPSELTIPGVDRFASSTRVTGPRSTRPGRAATYVVRVSGGFDAPTGRVAVRVPGIGRRVVTLTAGRAAVRLQAPRRPGVRKVTVRYLGSETVAPSTGRATWKVRRPARG
ncbi:CocE/NonD family hydrolase [Nocardioides pacificus]